MAIKVRGKCSKCGQVTDANGNYSCPKCGQPVSFEGLGMLQLYRKGSPLGIAMGFGIYIDGQPWGHLANKESIRIPLPFGTHTLHLTCGTNRRCNDLTFTLTPQAPCAYAKGSIKPGFWTNSMRIEPAQPSEMPME